LPGSATWVNLRLVSVLCTHVRGSGDFLYELFLITYSFGDRRTPACFGFSLMGASAPRVSFGSHCIVSYLSLPYRSAQQLLPRMSVGFTSHCRPMPDSNDALLRSPTPSLKSHWQLHNVLGYCIILLMNTNGQPANEHSHLQHNVGLQFDKYKPPGLNLWQSSWP
jgi:hypothetical protein